MIFILRKITRFGMIYAVKDSIKATRTSRRRPGRIGGVGIDQEDGMTYSDAVSSTLRRVALCALLSLCLMAGLLPRAGALVASPAFTVTRTADDPNPGSLRSEIALASAVSGSTVNFNIPATDPGVSSATGAATITLSLGPLVVSGTLRIVGPNSTGGAIVVSGANQSRVFTVTAGTVAFSSLTMENGNASQGNLNFPESEGGGGILNTANLTLTNCTVTGNTSTGLGPSIGGGGINNSGSSASLTMTNCTVSQNMGYFGNGGGIANSGTLLLTGCTLTGNSDNTDDVAGGGLSNTGTATLNTCTLSGNSAGGGFLGGGGGAYNSGTLTLNNCLVNGNRTSVNGGGIENDSGAALTLSACTISSNSAGRGFNSYGFGGGISSFGTAQITNSLVVNNSSFTNNFGSNAAGMYNGGTLTLINSTFAGNTLIGMLGGGSDTYAGGLLTGPATLTNDILYFDTTSIHSPPVPSEIAVPSGTTGPTVTYSDVQGGYTGAGNISGDPQFVRDPNPNASPVDNGDEHLQLTSPAVHTGTNGPGVPLTDIVGMPRPTPPARPSMGAYEVPGSSGGFSAQGGFVVTGTQGQSTGTQVVAKFLPGTTAGAFTATIDFGDGSGPMPGTVSPDPTTAGVLDVTGSHAYTGYGTFPITVVISGPGGTPTATVTSTANIQPAQIATNVTAQVSINRGGFIFNRATRRYVQTVTITNTGSAALTGPLSLVLDSLTPGATLVTETGTTQYVPPAGSPYQNAAAATLAPGASTSLVLQLTYTGTARFGYTPRVLAGPGAR